MQDLTNQNQIESQSRSPNTLVIFKECASCGKNYEFVKEYWDFDEDENCTFCSQGEAFPEVFTDLDYILLEDLDKYIPKRIQDCFSKIDEEIKPLPKEPVTEEKPKQKYKKKTKDKKDSQN